MPTRQRKTPPKTLIGVVDKHTFWGRTRVPLIKKLNPIWWFSNDTEQSADEAPWYHPEWSRARRYFYWNFLRNPLQNFRCFIIGVQDRNYAVTGRYPVLTIQRDDLVPPEYGFQCSVIWLLVPRPFISYSGKYVVWYVGTQPTGIFGLKFNLQLSRHSLPNRSIVSPFRRVASALILLVHWDAKVLNRRRTKGMALIAPIAAPNPAAIVTNQI